MWAQRWGHWHKPAVWNLGEFSHLNLQPPPCLPHERRIAFPDAGAVFSGSRWWMCVGEQRVNYGLQFFSVYFSWSVKILFWITSSVCFRPTYTHSALFLIDYSNEFDVKFNVNSGNQQVVVLPGTCALREWENSAVRCLLLRTPFCHLCTSIWSSWQPDYFSGSIAPSLRLSDRSLSPLKQAIFSQPSFCFSRTLSKQN